MTGDVVNGFCPVQLENWSLEQLWRVSLQDVYEFLAEKAKRTCFFVFTELSNFVRKSFVLTLFLCGSSFITNQNVQLHIHR